MQCYQRPTRRAICRARNAYSPSLALQAAFAGVASRRKDDRRIPSAWEQTEWEELKPNETSAPGQHKKEDEDGSSTLALNHSTTARPIAPGQGVSRGAKNARRRREASNVEAQPQVGPGEESAAEQGPGPTTRDRRVRERLLRYAAQKQSRAQARGRASPGTADMSDPKYWRDQAYGIRVIDAEGWKNHIGNLVALSRQVQEDKKYRREISSQEREQLKMAFDYLPIAILPREPTSESASLPAAPWELPLEERRDTPLRGDRLARYWFSREISRFVEFMKPTPLERTARAAATKEVKRFIDDSWTQRTSKDTGLEIHGSEKTGLATSTSDIDIRIFATDPFTLKFTSYHYSKSMLRRMQPIFCRLRSKPDVFGMVTLREGMHPIINFQHRPSGLDFQIVATASTKPQEETTRRYLADIPNLDDLFIVVRTFFEVRGLLPVHNGGIGSYGCFVMLLPPLLRVRAIASRGLEGMSTGGMLRRFLSFYTPSRVTNPVEHGVSCFPRQKFKKHDVDPQIGRYSVSARLRGDLVRAGQWRLCQRNEYQPYLLSIQDPANPNNDLGLRTHAIKHILATIIRTREDVGQWFTTMAGVDDPSQVYYPILHKIVGRPDLLYQHQRQVLEEYGRPLLASNDEASTSDMAQERSESSALSITK